MSGLPDSKKTSKEALLRIISEIDLLDRSDLTIAFAVVKATLEGSSPAGQANSPNNFGEGVVINPKNGKKYRKQPKAVRSELELGLMAADTAAGKALSSAKKALREGLFKGKALEWKVDDGQLFPVVDGKQAKKPVLATEFSSYTKAHEALLSSRVKTQKDGSKPSTSAVAVAGGTSSPP
jgi:hypothetical protein